MNRCLLGCAFVVAVLTFTPNAEAATAKIKVASVNGPAGKEVSVPIHVESKDEMGCMQFALVYDPAILEVKGLEAGPLLPADATVDFKADQAGYLQGGFVCSVTKAGAKGDGAALKVVFMVKGQPGQKSPLKLEKVRAWETSDPEILVQTEAGELTVVSPSQIPWLHIGIAAGVLVLLLLVFLIARRGHSQPATAHAPTTSAAPPRFAPDEPTFQHICKKCGGSIRLPRSMVGQTFQCAGCGTTQIGGQ